MCFFAHNFVLIRQVVVFKVNICFLGQNDHIIRIRPKLIDVLGYSKSKFVVIWSFKGTTLFFWSKYCVSRAKFDSELVSNSNGSHCYQCGDLWLRQCHCALLFGCWYVVEWYQSVEMISIRSAHVDLIR